MNILSDRHTLNIIESLLLQFLLERAKWSLIDRILLNQRWLTKSQASCLAYRCIRTLLRCLWQIRQVLIVLVFILCLLLLLSLLLSLLILQLVHSPQSL